jgi:ribonuclease E
MEEKRNNRSVERKLKDALKNDRARIQVGRISHFGLLEMSRQRIRTGVLESTTTTCPVCQGSGHVRAPASVALHVLRSLEDQLIKGVNHHLTVRTRTAVALYILNQKRAHLSELEHRFGLTITVLADESVSNSAHYVVERGEPIERRELPPAFVQPDSVQPVEPYEEVDEEIEDEEVEAEAEADSEPVATNGDDHGEGEGRGRRRRRRRRRGGGSEAREPAEPRDEAPAAVHAEGGETTDAGDDEDDEGDDAQRQASGDGGNGDGGDSARRRRRGRRGGRRGRRGRGDENGRSQDQPSGETGEPVHAEPGRAEPFHAGNGHAGNGAGTAAEAVPAPAAELPAAEPVAAEPAAPVAESPAPEAYQPPVPAEPIRYTAPEPEAAEEPEAAAEPAAPAPAAAPEPAEEDPNRPKRGGWWQRRSFF